MNSSEECKVVSGTKEWAVRNENCISGCSHNCKYCYARSMASRFGRIASQDWHDETVRFRDLYKMARKCSGVIMFPSAHDITPAHLDECIYKLDDMLMAGNHVLIVSKPHLECIKAICDKFTACRDQIMFRFTIGSNDSEILKFWEPNAPDFNERIECLKRAFIFEYKTSVSCEPMLDNNVMGVISKVRPYVTDSIWLGKTNRLKGILSLNGFKNNKEVMQRAKELELMLSDEYILQLYEMFKDDHLIKWKDSIKKLVGIARPTEAGLDI